MHERLVHFLQQSGGAINTSRHPELKNLAAHARRRGELVRVLPGVHALADCLALGPAIIRQWDEDAVFLGATAARLSWWPDVPERRVHVQSRRRTRHPPPWLRPERSAIDPDLVCEVAGFRLAHPAASVIEMSADPAFGAGVIDEALRRRAVDLKSLHWARGLLRRRRGFAIVDRHLHESRDSPWSFLERRAHVLLREAGITGWRANHRHLLPTGELIHIDIAFPALKIAIEIDGWEFHGSEEAFHRDRFRDAQLTAQGWIVLRFTARNLHHLPTLVEQVRRFGSLPTRADAAQARRSS